MSVVLVIAVGLFFLRDNIAKFINNAATQITGEESRPEGMNEYGFYFGKNYWNEEDGVGFVFHEDGSADMVDKNGNVFPYDWAHTPSGSISYANGTATTVNGVISFSSDGKRGSLLGSSDLVLQE